VFGDDREVAILPNQEKNSIMTVCCGRLDADELKLKGVEVSV
jgi:hypothetical protein